MKAVQLHPWDVSPGQAKRIQEELRARLSAVWEPVEVKSVAGVDVGMQGNLARAAIVILSYPELLPLEEAKAEIPVTFPYIPGLLAFREAPAILAACEHLIGEPDLILVDGQGLAHPRRLGIASHIGIILDKPSIGCAKSLLVGTYHEPPQEVGSFSQLYDGDEVIGAVVRTRSGVQPVYVSIGHKMDLERAIKFVLSFGRGYRLPEPIRWAHRLAEGESIKKGAKQESFFDLL